MRGGDCRLHLLIRVWGVEGRDGCALFCLLKGPCAQTVYTLTLKYRYKDYIEGQSVYYILYRCINP